MRHLQSDGDVGLYSSTIILGFKKENVNNEEQNKTLNLVISKHELSNIQIDC